MDLAGWALHAEHTSPHCSVGSRLHGQLVPNWLLLLITTALLLLLLLHAG
jgi:hypothetical protein